MFHSEYGQDRWLAEQVFGERRDGVFVEFGALDGLLHSNSLYFERERGWRGLLAEANPALWDALAVNRPYPTIVKAAVAGEAGPVEIAAISGPLIGWSGILKTMAAPHLQRIRRRVEPSAVSTVTVPGITLGGLLRSAGLKQIDYLSIDVEGAEADILAPFPFADYDIDVIGVEENFAGSSVAAIMAKHGYRMLARVGVDNFYRRASQ